MSRDVIRAFVMGVTVAGLCALSGPIANAAQKPAAELQVEDDDDFEEVEVAAVEMLDEAEGFTLKKVIGRLHPAAVHMPIAWLMLLVLMELWGA